MFLKEVILIPMRRRRRRRRTGRIKFKCEEAVRGREYWEKELESVGGAERGELET